MADLSEVWGSPFPKKHHNMTSKYHKNEEPRDAEKEGRVFPTPIHRTAAALQRHRKTIDDLSGSLPIAGSDEDAESNYGPAKVGQSGMTEHFTSQVKKPYSKPFVPTDTGTTFPYAPQSFQEDALSLKIEKMMRMIEQNKTGYESPASHDMMLYIFTGVFFLFTFDTFVSLGKAMK